MGLFSRSRGLSREGLEDVLYDIGFLESEDRDTLKEAFSTYASGGVSKYEVKRVISRMISDKEDSVNRSEAKAVRRKLLRALKGKK